MAGAGDFFGAELTADCAEVADEEVASAAVDILRLLMEG
jgi:hypothetical protein